MRSYNYSAYDMNKVININTANKSCSLCSLSHMCLPPGLNHRELAKLEHIARHERFLKKGESLFKPGQQLKSLYVVRSGSIKTYLATHSGAQQVVGFHMPGKFLGFDAMGDGKHTCTAEALESSNICELPYAQLYKVAQQITGLNEYYMSLMGHEIAEEHKMMLMLGRRSANERIATFLLNISDNYSKRGYSPVNFNLTMSRHDISNYLGLAVETISRSITHMQSIGIISVERKYIRIIDMPRLRKLASAEVSVTPPLEEQAW